MSENFDYVKDIGALSLEQKREFYVLWGHNLTVSVRAICWNEEYSDKDKVAGMGAINEIMHRLIFRVQELHKISSLEDDSWIEEDFWSLIKHHCSEVSKELVAEIGRAIKTSYK